MTKYLIGELAQRYKISRSGLLHYHRLGLLVPSGRKANGYRYYTAADAQRLEQILIYRQAGLALADITRLLAHTSQSQQPNPGVQLLQQRLEQINLELQQLREQQQRVLQLLNADATCTSQFLNKAAWVDLLRTSGLDEAGMLRWHQEFERKLPAEHDAFLRRLGIAEAEIKQIRANSALTSE